jgi:hypothetical protein
LWFILLLLAGAGSPHAAGLTLDAVNKAEFTAAKSKGLNRDRRRWGREF